MGMLIAPLSASSHFRWLRGATDRQAARSIQQGVGGPPPERFVRSIMEECLGRMIMFGEGSLQRAIHE
jgi:hypothetical protein